MTQFIRDPLAHMREGDLVEAVLRICSARGDTSRAHLRRPPAGTTLCGRPAVTFEGFDEEKREVAAASRGLKACAGCAKRAPHQERFSAFTRATQMVMRDPAMAKGARG